MELYDPFEQISKNYGRGIESPKVRIIAALMPTGRHVGNANALHHTHNSRGGGGPATKLERYHHKSSGSVHKGMVFQDGMSKGLRSAFKAGFDPALRGPAKGAAGRLGGAARKLSDAANAPRNVSGSGTFARKQAMQQSSLRRAGPIGF
jgi:hypothetical protein